MSSSMKEALKEAGRWLVCLIVGWFIGSILDQIAKVPEFYSLHVWVFLFNIPIRLSIKSALSLAARALDKWQHENGKETKTYPAVSVPSMGWIKF